MLNPMLYPCYDMHNNFGQDSGVIEDKKRLADEQLSVTIISQTEAMKIKR